ncbi:6-phosphogluconate dehydrogenase [Crassisporium funariophilum]|nr:6-phosphogluconate dehydrogenase [Crassisporium funariophilum]
MASGPLKDVLLVGFGAVGAIYSLILKRSGMARVTAVARSNYDIVNSDGVHFQSRKYGDIRGWKPDRLCRSVEEAADRQYSYVMVTTKAIPELIKTSKILAPLLSTIYTEKFAQPTYVLMQNGLNVEVDLFNAINDLGKGAPSILSTAVWIGTNLLAPNVVEHNEFDRVTLGVYRHKNFTTTINSPEESALLQDFGKILESGGTTLQIVPEIQRMKFAKNFWNVSMSSFSTLTHYTLPAIFRHPPEGSTIGYKPFVSPTTADLISTYTIPTITAVLEELLTLGRALGFPDTSDGLPSSTVTNVIQNTRAIHEKADSTHVPSMLLDAEKGQPIEVEVILGEVVRMAKDLNVDIPRIETLYALLLIVQNQILRNLESGR